MQGYRLVCGPGPAALTGTKTMLFLADSATWFAVGLALGAVALGLALLAAVLVLRRRLAAREEVERLLAASDQRLERTMRELGGALEGARRESLRSQRLAEITSTIDLDRVLERTLGAAVSLPGADAAMIVLSPENGDPLLATVGMSAEEAARQPVSAPTSGTGARAVRVSYRYDGGEGDEADLIRGGMAVPLRDEEGSPLGTLGVFWRRDGREASDAELAELEKLAGSAGPAITNAQRFRKAREQADLDGLTNLHNRRYFHETLAREVARAGRYDRRLSLLVIDIDDFKAINDRVGHLAGDAVLAAVAERLQSAVRGADVACRIGGDEFAVLMPEASFEDAERLLRRIQLAVSARSLAPADRVSISAGAAELRAHDDAASLFQRADEALYRAKGGRKGRGREAGPG
jgi:diguanylate cyclase (GGDEF)-like protein